jgi:hypothetical protein
MTHIGQLRDGNVKLPELFKYAYGDMDWGLI